MIAGAKSAGWNPTALSSDLRVPMKPSRWSAEEHSDEWNIVVARWIVVRHTGKIRTARCKQPTRSVRAAQCRGRDHCGVVRPLNRRRRIAGSAETGYSYRLNAPQEFCRAQAREARPAPGLPHRSYSGAGIGCPTPENDESTGEKTFGPSLPMPSSPQ